MVNLSLKIDNGVVRVSTFQIVMAVLTLSATVIMGIMGWVVAGIQGTLKTIKEEIKANAKDISDHREKVAREYAPREDVRLEFTALESRIVKRVDTMETSMGKQFDSLFNMLRSVPRDN